MIRRFSFVAVAAFLLVGSPSGSTTWLPPARPLTDDEKLELAVSESDAVGLGAVVALHDTVVDVVNGTGIPSRSLTLRVSEWLVGGAGSPTLEVGLAAGDDSPLFSELLTADALDAKPAAFFLRRVASGWTLRDGPDQPALQRLASADAAALRQRLVRAIARQRPDSLLARADLVIVGTRGVFDARCATSPGIRECAPVGVKEVLAGPAVTDSVVVYGAMSGSLPAGEALYLLRRTSDGLYETVGFRSGSLPIEAGRIARWGLTLDQVRPKARAARAAGRKWR